MEVSKALALELGALPQPVVTGYQLGFHLFNLYQAKMHRGETLTKLKKELPKRLDFKRVINQLISNGVLQPHRDFSGHVFSLLGKEPNAPEVACSVDPFAYLSHLSAMEYHGLTQRLPKLLFLSSPFPEEWRRSALERMKKDLSEELLERYARTGLPALTQVRFTKIGRHTVQVFASSHLGAFLTVRDRTLRIATLGRTFLDMLRQPDLCGSIYHVLEVFEAHAVHYLPLILDELDQHGSKIDKVRAGYVLEERCGLRNQRIERWQAAVQRGGSRKLYAQGGYSSRFSERWSLSLNVEAR